MKSIASLSAAVALVFGLSLVSAPALPHSGGLDSSGCHTNRKTGDYHCHRSQSPPPSSARTQPATSGIVKKSKTGICHDQSSPWYGQTIHYTEFSTLEACLNSGGRLPKG
jgi:hypothetical protein